MIPLCMSLICLMYAKSALFKQKLSTNIIYKYDDYLNIKKGWKYSSLF